MEVKSSPINFEIGQEVKFQGKQYRIVGDDTASEKHPARTGKWDYMLRDIISDEVKYVSSEDMLEFAILLPLK